MKLDHGLLKNKVEESTQLHEVLTYIQKKEATFATTFTKELHVMELEEEKAYLITLNIVIEQPYRQVFTMLHVKVLDTNFQIIANGNLQRVETFDQLTTQIDEILMHYDVKKIEERRINTRKKNEH